MKKTILLFFIVFSIYANAQNVIYVDTDATGTGDGTSWTNAYPYIQTALSSASNGAEIWIADGKYGVHPASVISRNLTFNWTADSVKVMGGFNGTETSADQRNPATNITILSGDLYDDGDATNNMYTTLSGPRGTSLNPITYSYVDGITIQDGYSDNPFGKGYNGGKWGGGFFLQNYVSKVVFNNCTFKDNYAQGGAAMAFEPVSTDAEVYINNCKFENNKGDYGNCITTIVHDASLDLEVKNCLFTSNVAKAFLSTDIGGVFYLNTSGSGDFNFDLLNSTIADNLDSSGGNVSQNEHALIYFYIGNETPVRDLNIQNCIMYNNETVDKTIAPYPSPGSVYDNMSLNNCISEINNYADSVVLNNVSTADPMFTDAPGGDYTLKAGSPAINGGSISGINYLATDLAGNERINSGTIDMGCYEYQRTASVSHVKNNLQFNAYPNPTNGTIRIKSLQPISTIDVLNNIGQVVAHYENINSIDISHLPNGMYFIKAQSKNDVGVKQIIKN